MVNLWGPGAFGAARPAAVRPTFSPDDGPGDTDDWLQDCSSPRARDGTEWRSALVNALIAQLRGVVRNSTVAPTNLDDALLAKAIQSGAFNYAVATGSANAWVVAPALAVPAYAAGRVLNIVAPATNTSTTVNMNVSGLGNRRIKKRDGTDPAIGDLVSGRVYQTIDDGTNVRVLASLPSDGLPSAIINSGAVTYFRTPGTATYTTPAGIIGVRVKVWGAGGGGGISPSTAGNAGGSSSFGALLTATAGGGAFANRVGGNAGSGSAGGGVGNAVVIDGTPGSSGNDGGTTGYPGGAGGASFGAPGGAGGGGTVNSNGTPSRTGTAGIAGMAPGGGGGGQGTNGTSGGTASGGGGGGGYIEGWNPAANLPGSVTITVGAGGTAASSSGGNGANGMVAVEEVY